MMSRFSVAHTNPTPVRSAQGISSSTFTMKILQLMGELLFIALIMVMFTTVIFVTFNGDDDEECWACANECVHEAPSYVDPEDYDLDVYADFDEDYHEDIDLSEMRGVDYAE